MLNGQRSKTTNTPQTQTPKDKTNPEPGKQSKLGESIFDKGARQLLGNNSMLSFWHDKWLKDGTLRGLIQGPLSREEDNIVVSLVSMVNGILVEF